MLAKGKREVNSSKLTVSAGLDGSFDVTDALDGDTVLVVLVDELVLELTNLVDQNTELVGDIRDVVITSLAPNAELLLSLCQLIEIRSIMSQKR